MTKHRRTISKETKRQALDDIRSGRKTDAEVRRELRLSPSMLQRWKKKPASYFETDAAAGNAENETAAPKTEIVESAPAALPVVFERPRGPGKRISPELKARAVAEYRGGVPVSEVARRYNASTQAIYTWANPPKRKTGKGKGESEGNGKESGKGNGNGHGKGNGHAAGASVLRISDLISARNSLDQALALLRTIECPGCALSFIVEPPDEPTTLLMLARHRLNAAGGE